MSDLRPFPARLVPELYDELKTRAESERKSMNTLLNEALADHLRVDEDPRAALLRVLAILERRA
ncbi:MAG: hypothetical protein WCE44_06765 [Candidatus Velthaea sp.]